MIVRIRFVNAVRLNSREEVFAKGEEYDIVPTALGYRLTPKEGLNAWIGPMWPKPYAVDVPMANVAYTVEEITGKTERSK